MKAIHRTTTIVRPDLPRFEDVCKKVKVVDTFWISFRLYFCKWKKCITKDGYAYRYKELGGNVYYLKSLGYKYMTMDDYNKAFGIK